MKPIQDKIQTKIISAFPGTGKTFFTNLYKDSVKVLDSDSSNFDKESFPQNYIQHIKSNVGKVDIILVSSHLEVRKALIEEGLKFYLAVPEDSEEARKVYKDRYLKRGSSKEFVEIVMNNWSNWLKSCYEIPNCVMKYEMYPEEYLTEAYDFIELVGFN